jgi:YD repeat-containing protein
LGDLDYSYDQAGHGNAVWGSYAHTLLPAAMSCASYDATNELTSNSGTSYSDDQNGNLTNDGTNTYTWNERNQLTQATGTTSSASLTYDPLGRRLSKTVNSTTTGVPLGLPE